MKKRKSPLTVLRQTLSKNKNLQPAQVAATLPPLKVVKALYDFTAETTDEISFSKGDFFHVVNDDDADWYEATNPMTNSFGFVPKNHFEVFDRVDRVAQARKSSEKKAAVQLMATATYPFDAEREDELSTVAGDTLLIMAVSNKDWVLLRHVGKVAQPGLVPVSFVEIKDLSTGEVISDLAEFCNRTGHKIPSVEEWKEQVTRANANVVKLRIIESETTLTHKSHKKAASVDSLKVPTVASSVKRTSENTLKKTSLQVDVDRFSSSLTLKENVPEEKTLSLNRVGIASVTVPSFEFNDGRYRFLVEVTQHNGQKYILHREYEEFYNLQIHLLAEFPVEAGRTGKKRILPYLPGPVSVVDENVSNQRRLDLDIYVKQLIHLPPAISFSPKVDEFFLVKKRESVRKSIKDISKKVASTVPMIKVKLIYKNEVLVMRIPKNINFEGLMQKVHEKMTGECVAANLLKGRYKLSIKDEDNEFYKVENDNDLDAVVDYSADKLILYVA